MAPARAMAGSPAASFLAVGMAGLAADWAVFVLLNGIGWSVAPARACSLALATVITWLLNRRLTFRSADARTLAEITRYATVALAAQGFNFGLFVLGCFLLPTAPPSLLLFVSAAASAVFSYTGHRFFTFRAPG